MAAMDSDNDIRAALRNFADGDLGQPDLEVIRAGHHRDRRYGPVQTLLAVAVVVLIAAVGVVLVMQVMGGSRQQQPITPTPSPTQSRQPSPQPSPAPTSSSPSPAPSPTGFAVNPGSGVNPGPVGAVGDTIAGLRLDSVQIRAGSCGGTPCPERFAMTVTNTTGAAGTWEVFVYTYRDGYAELGNAAQVTLAPGEQTKARVTIDPSQAADTGGSSTYSWNWSAETNS